MQQNPNNLNNSSNSDLQNTQAYEETTSNQTFPSQPPQSITTQNSDSIDKTIQLVWFLVGFINVILALRIVFLLFNAQTSGFIRFLFNVTGIFSMPFFGIFPAPTEGTTYFDTAALVAIIIYSLIAWGVVTLIKIVSDKKKVV